MKIAFDDGQEFWVDGDTLPPNMTIAQLKLALVPYRLHQAQEQLIHLQQQLEAIPVVSDTDLLAWAKQSHPTPSVIALLQQQITEQEAIIQEYA